MPPSRGSRRRQRRNERRGGADQTTSRSGGGHGGWGGRNPRDLALPWQRGAAAMGLVAARGCGARRKCSRALEDNGGAADAHLHHELKASSPWHAAGKDLAPIALSHMFQRAAGPPNGSSPLPLASLVLYPETSKHVTKLGFFQFWLQFF
jgi:hypothetical protein